MQIHSVFAVMFVVLAGTWFPVTVSAQPTAGSPTFSVAHGAQGTGNYKGKKDRHEKPGPMNEKKRKKPSWVSK